VKNKTITSLFILMTLGLATCSAPAAAPTPTNPPASIPTLAAPTTPPTSAPSPSATLETYTDPFAYCAAMVQIDAPDARYTGPLMSAAFFNAYLKAAGLDPNGYYPDAFKKMTIWRCMNGQVYVCNFGANIPCDSKADTNKKPTQALTDYCKVNPDTDFIPAYVTGHAVIYSWHCVKDVPEVLQQIDTVDPAGYQSSFWKLVPPAQ
jgi:hypothetical protein